MTSKRSLAAITLLAAISCNAEEPTAKSEAWPTGFWQMTSDEDKNALGEIFEFRSDGAVVLYDSACNSQNFPDEITYRIDRGDIYVTNHLPGKDHASLLLHTSQDKRSLIFTWPDTGKRATLERMPRNECVEKS